jgi:hypothetical protein
MTVFEMTALVLVIFLVARIDNHMQRCGSLLEFCRRSVRWAVILCKTQFCEYAILNGRNKFEQLISVSNQGQCSLGNLFLYVGSISIIIGSFIAKKLSMKLRLD